MLRRSSYASVAAGNAAGSGQSQNNEPTRSGAFSHLINSSNGPGPQATPFYPNHARHHTHPRSANADGHHSNMSTSWGRAGNLPSYSSSYGYMNSYGVGASDGLSSSFFVPSYLRGSRHAERLEEVHKARLVAQREYRSGHSSNGGSLSTSSSSVNLHKMAPSHRGMTHEIIERAPVFVEEPVAPWPTRWSEVDKYMQLEIEDGGKQAKYNGSQKSHDEAAAVRADHPMPRQCGIYYYEVTVVSKGKDGMIGIGFCGSKVALSRIPGWEPDSFAYHGDDGQTFSNTTSGKPYGPKFGTLDVIGCGINFHTGMAFFTKNGVFLGNAFRDVKADRLYYPTVGMKKPGETLRANFGQEPFSFDIDAMVAQEKAVIMAGISTLKSSPNLKTISDEVAFIHSLVGQYLAHDGYVEAARAFTEEVYEEERALANDGDADIGYTEIEEDLDAINRQKIRAAILEGDIDKALKHTNAYYPSVLRDNENIYFKLRCRKFIEMIRRHSELHAHINAPTPPSKRSTASNGFGTEGTDDYDDFEMELDEQLGVHNSTPQLGLDNMDTADEHEDNEMKFAKLTGEMLTYGQELKAEFAHDPRREVKRALEDTFALVAYEITSQSPLAPLLETSGRVPVAEELNSAILVSLGKSSSAALERMYQQTEALVTELAEDGGPGAFINVRGDILS